MTKPIITVIVCTYNRASLLKHCLDSLSKQSLDNDLFEVIIVDNNSNDNTQEIAKRYTQAFNNFILLKECKQGLSNARNKGWRNANSNIVAFIDDDARATPHWCQRIVKAFEAIKPKPIAVGGPIYPWYEVKPPKWFSGDFEKRYLGETPHFLEGNRARYGFSGSNMAFPLKILIKYKGFSLKYGVVGNKLRLGDDVELFSRIYKNKAHFWYDPKIMVYHWTPFHKMDLMYRLKRGYRAGHSLSLMKGQNKIFLNFGKLIISLMSFIIQLPFAITKSREERKKTQILLIVRLAEYLGNIAGYLQLIWIR